MMTLVVVSDVAPFEPHTWQHQEAYPAYRRLTCQTLPSLSVWPDSQLLLGSSCTLPVRLPVSCTADEQSRVGLSGLPVHQHRLGRGHGRQVNLRHTPYNTPTHHISNSIAAKTCCHRVTT
jgi:hypothetical protein